MNAFLEFIKDLLTLRTTWIDKGQGRWVARRRMHPLMRLIVFCGAAAAVTVLGVELLRSGPVPAPEAEVPLSGPLDSPDVPALLADEALDAASSEPGAVLPEVEEPEDETPEMTEPAPTTSAPQPPRDAGKYWILINKGQYRLSLYRGRDLVKTYNVAIGKNPGNKRRVGDNRTPEGQFRVLSIENASGWKHDFGDGKGEIAGAYGPWFIRLDTGGWKGIGIHGTHAPDSLGTMASEGCIRMNNDEIRDLKNYAYRNMVVRIEK